MTRWPVYQEVRARLRRPGLLVRALRYLRGHRYYFSVMRLMFRVVRRLPADRGLVVFESGMGTQYGDSPRYIYEELLRRRPGLRAVWVYPGELPGHPQARTVVRNSPQYFFALARAKYWVNNQSFTHYLTRRPDGVFLQTWHGTPLKRMLYDVAEVHGRDAGYVRRAATGAAQWSVLLSPSPYATQVMRSAFRYRGQVLELGYPRNDVLHSPGRAEMAAAVRAALGIRPDQRVVLYAPTFRDNQTARPGNFTFELPFDLDAWPAAVGEDTVLLLRMHVNVRSKPVIAPHLQQVVRDVSDYPEIQELCLASDVLITDYSSVLFDFAQLRRPMLFYAFDLELYRETLRGFYLDYDAELPGPVVTDQAGVVEALAHLDDVEARFAARREAFLERFAPRDDGHATERVVDAVFGVVD